MQQSKVSFKYKTPDMLPLKSFSLPTAIWLVLCNDYMLEEAEGSKAKDSGSELMLSDQPQLLACMVTESLWHRFLLLIMCQCTGYQATFVSNTETWPKAEEGDEHIWSSSWFSPSRLYLYKCLIFFFLGVCCCCCCCYVYIYIHTLRVYIYIYI